MIRIVSICLVISVFLSSCSRGYKPIEYGEQACDHCKMTIFDPRFAAELVDGKGKVFKFDDIICLNQYKTSKNIAGEQLLIFVEQYNDEINTAIDARNAIYLQSEFFASPMNGNYAAFENMDEAMKLADSLNINVLNWSDIN